MAGSFGGRAERRVPSQIGVRRVRLTGGGHSAPVLRQDRKSLQDGWRRLSGRVVQLVDEQLGYQVQACHKITQPVRVIRDENRQRPRL
jgi:hypothetical protein